MPLVAALSFTVIILPMMTYPLFLPLEVPMSIFTAPNSNGLAIDTDLDVVDSGNSCGDHFEQYEQNAAVLSLLQSIDNALIMLHAQSSPEILRTIASGLLCFPPHIVDQVCAKAALRLRFNPVPSDFIDLACKFYGVRHEDLLAQGRAAFYSLFNLNEPEHDLVCEDWRSIFAIKKEFSSLQNFFSTNTKEDPCWKQKRFAEAYASIDFLDEGSVHKEYFLAGFEYRRLSRSHRRLNFVGNYETCLQILSTLPNASEYEIPNPPQTPDETLYTFGRKSN